MFLNIVIILLVQISVLILLPGIRVETDYLFEYRILSIVFFKRIQNIFYNVPINLHKASDRMSVVSQTIFQLYSTTNEKHKYPSSPTASFY